MLKKRAEKAERADRAARGRRGRKGRSTPSRPLRPLSALSALSVLSCARIEPPPGGPPDNTPPQLIATRPESLAVIPGFKGEVEFQFDEVVSEGGSAGRGSGEGGLERLLILSPTTRVPNVDWHRTRIGVKPAEGWRPNRVYRVELLPGVTDLRQNRSDEGRVLTFTTGAPRPETTLRGTVVEWTTSRPAPAALVIATLLPDSLPYRGLADSSGRFTLGPLPRGEYLVYGVLDQDRDQMLEPREAYDTVRMAAGKLDAGEIWAFLHDTTPPRLQTATVDDSVTATLAFSQMLTPTQRYDVRSVSVRLLPDSTPVRVVSILSKPVADSLRRKTVPDTTARDTTRRDTTAAADTLAPAAPRLDGARGARRELEPLKSRPALFDRLVLQVAEPWRPGGRYAVEVRAVRNVTGVAGDVRGVIAVPERRPVPADTGAADSVRADSLRTDSLRRKPGRRP